MKTIFKYLKVLIMDFLPVIVIILIAAFLKHDIWDAVYIELLLSGNLIWINCIWMGNMSVGLYAKVKEKKPLLNSFNWVIAMASAIIYGIIKTVTYLEKTVNALLLIIVSCTLFAFALGIYIVYIYIVQMEKKNA